MLSLTPVIPPSPSTQGSNSIAESKVKVFRNLGAVVDKIPSLMKNYQIFFQWEETEDRKIEVNIQKCERGSTKQFEVASISYIAKESKIITETKSDRYLKEIQPVVTFIQERLAESPAEGVCNFLQAFTHL